jgi:endonuclease/exonuclease/phosphatase family metal-dependent hydrolase
VLTLATFNVLDLFDAGFGGKLDWTAQMIDRADADVVGLEEVGERPVLDALVARLSTARGAYGEPVVGTRDDRGIRCALLSRLPVVEAKVHTAARLDFPAFYEGDPPPFGDRVPLRRGIVHARVEVPAMGPLDVFVAHLKSRSPVPLRSSAGEPLEPASARERAEGDLRSLVHRAAEALFLRGLVDDVLGRAPGGEIPHVAVMGDLNDVAGSVTLGVITGSEEDARARLFSCADLVPEGERYSVLHAGRRDLIDHILVTRPLRARLASAAVLNDELRDHGAPTRDTPPSVVSDHAPLVARFA